MNSAAEIIEGLARAGHDFRGYEDFFTHYPVRYSDPEARVEDSTLYVKDDGGTYVSAGKISGITARSKTDIRFNIIPSIKELDFLRMHVSECVGLKFRISDKIFETSGIVRSFSYDVRVSFDILVSLDISTTGDIRQILASG